MSQNRESLCAHILEQERERASLIGRGGVWGREDPPRWVLATSEKEKRGSRYEDVPEEKLWSGD